MSKKSEDTVKNTAETPDELLERLAARLEEAEKKLARLAAQPQEPGKAGESEEERARAAAAEAYAHELIDYYIDTGSTLSNQNVEVSVNGIQYIVPKGEVVKIPRFVAEVIENAKRQRAFASGVQKKATDVYRRALNAGAI